MLHKIGMIKALREFAACQLGVELGLKEAKDIIDPIYEQANRARLDKMSIYFAQLKNGGMNRADINSVLDTIYTEPWYRAPTVQALNSPDESTS